MSREIIPQNQTIIVLDTNVFRNFCYDRPSWVDCFEAMSKNGYHICLTDVAFAEIIKQIINQQMKFSEFKTSVSQVQRFISKDLPILPGNKSLLRMCNISENSKKNILDVVEKISFSKSTWNYLRQIKTYDDFVKSQFNFSAAGKLLETEAQEWITFLGSQNPPKDTVSNYFSTISKAFENLFSSSPKFSVRAEIALLYFSRLFHKISHQQFNPNSKKRVNDGIDFLYFLNIMLPSILCTKDRFRKNLKSLNSYQSDWVLTPKEIELNWNQKNLVDPQFPN